MKKTKIIAGFVAVAAAAVTLTACGGSASEYKGLGTASMEVPAKDYNGFFKHTVEVYKDYVDLADYKNLEVEDVDRSNEEISDEAVDTIIQSIETEHTQQEDVTDGGTTQDGDIITLDFVGSIDGVEFDGGSATDYTYTVGSGNFISDLDEGLKGKQANTEYEIPAKFPDDYGSEELNGKDSVFKVTITAINRPSAPEIDDAWVKDNAKELENEGYGSGLATLDALREGIRAELKEEAVENNNSAIAAKALEQLLEESEIKEYPEDEVAEIETNIKNNFNSEFEQYKSYMSAISSSVTTETESEDGSEGETQETTEETTAEVTFLDYLHNAYSFETEEEYEEYVNNYAKSYIAQKMIVSLIGSDQGITASADEINERGNELATAYGYDSYQTLVESYGAGVNCDVGYQIIYSKVSDYLAKNVKTVPASETTESEEPTTQEAEESSEETTTETTDEGETTETSTEVTTESTENTTQESAEEETTETTTE